MKRIIICLLTALLILLICVPARAETVQAYRALCIGITDYKDGRARQGGINSTQGVYDALSRSFGGRNSYESEFCLDPGKEELLLTIENAFRAADENDISIIYINAHGGTQGGISWIEAADTLVVTAGELERVTRQIPGRVVLLIDCCNSGGFIGTMGVYASGFESAFSMNSFSRDKYLVLTSCTGEENSYRVTAGEMTEESMSTAFARALCEGLGWDLVNDRAVSLRSDSDGDRTVTFTELYLYTRRRCMYYLYGSGVYQSVCVSPEGDAFLMASRR